MRKAARNYILVLVMALCKAISSFVPWLVLPRGGGYQGGKGTAGSTFLWSRDSWMNIHD
jgi:hypothetical protein